MLWKSCRQIGVLLCFRYCCRAKDAGQDVLIGGTGADDLFAGYRRHQALHYYNALDKIPAS
ncbi:MAG: asparagine synthase-related protein [Chitinophagaceae bacterium]